MHDMLDEYAQNLSHVRMATLLSAGRLLCNRCATTLDVLFAHCDQCQADLCPACCGELTGKTHSGRTCT